MEHGELYLSVKFCDPKEEWKKRAYERSLFAAGTTSCRIISPVGLSESFFCGPIRFPGLINKYSWPNQ